ncbi:phage major capsid family protein [Brachybacterium alimentarium]|uniref:phage major capsid family protein n=1 Tax=Brachybacterium alimentarium TaxID=47845 RepID=UPI003FD555DF
MAVLTTGDLVIPTQILDPWIKSVANGSVVSTLSPNLPMKFGKGEAFTFGTDEAEYVGEGQNKGDSEFTSSVQTVEPFKFHKTVRMTDEVVWADEDHQLGVIQQILAEIQPALSRALDYGVIHGVNPKTGAVVAAMARKLADADSVELDEAEEPFLAIDRADAAVLAAGGLPSDLAIDPTFAVKFATLRDKDGRKLYPDVSYTTAASTLENHRSSVSKTVSGAGVVAEPSGILAIDGDFSAIRWGVQKSIGLKLIEYGDPDGNGDLQRNNQVAFRAEVVYGWGIADLDVFNLIKAADAEGN